MAKGSKTVRFQALVDQSGPPEVHTLWSDPSHDAAFQKALRENRVATLRQRNVGTKKDFGIVGFHRMERASHLIFPKPLKAPEGAKIIGIKYGQITAPSVSDPVTVRARSRGKRAGGAASSKSIEKSFRATLRLTLTVEAEIEVEAPGKTEAGKLALQKADLKPEMLQKGKVTKKVLRLTPSE